MNNISFRNVDITGGFWKNRQDMNRDVTIYAVQDRFTDTGRFDAFKCDWEEGKPHKPDPFWDSDIAKWVEGACYIMEKQPNPKLEAAIEQLIDRIEANQGDDGYFNTYFMVCDPKNRWKDRTMHELYNAGHLMEAAVAYYQVSGKDRFLKLMCKYADYIEKVFVIEGSAEFVTPGHQEIELALVKLYHATKEKRYLELSKFFIDQRGANEKDVGKTYPNGKENYLQNHLPVREQTTAEGHSVRVGYMCAAMADLAKECNDESLLKACKTLFDNIINKRMYITGGIGQSHIGEAFTADYDLPNKTSYAETCAAISLIYFASRMLKLEANSAYADIIERCLYNGMLSGISLNGRKFFYENPLEIDPALLVKDNSILEKDRTRFPIIQRVEVFDCSCCPPNLNRFFASLGDYIYSVNGDTVFVHQFMDSKMESDDISITQSTEYPKNGKITIQASGVSRVAVRIPGWCNDYSISGEYAVKNGYAYIENSGSAIEVDFKMIPTLIQSSPKVQENAGRAALQYGPMVYCLEEVDNGKYLRNIKVDKNLNASIEYCEMFGANVVMAEGYRPKENDTLYYPLDDSTEKVRLKFIPYFAFANRGVSEMLIWVDVK